MADTLINKARTFARHVHTGLKRKNITQEPSLVHLAEVALFVEVFGGTKEQVAAAWLHDTVEDTKVTLDQIKMEFGDKVAELVDGLTDPPEFKQLPTLERKTLQAERLREKSPEIKLIKLADQLSNVRSIALDHPVKWSNKKCMSYIEGARRISLECRGICRCLESMFERAYRVAFRVHNKV